ACHGRKDSRGSGHEPLRVGHALCAGAADSGLHGQRIRAGAGGPPGGTGYVPGALYGRGDQPGSVRGDPAGPADSNAASRFGGRVRAAQEDLRAAGGGLHDGRPASGSPYAAQSTGEAGARRRGAEGDRRGGGHAAEETRRDGKRIHQPQAARDAGHTELRERNGREIRPAGRRGGKRGHGADQHRVRDVRRPRETVRRTSGALEGNQGGGRAGVQRDGAARRTGRSGAGPGKSRGGRRRSRLRGEAGRLGCVPEGHGMPCPYGRSSSAMATEEYIGKMLCRWAISSTRRTFSGTEASTSWRLDFARLTWTWRSAPTPE